MDNLTVENSGDTGRERTVSESSEGEIDPQFKPLVSLPLVEVSTNEEDEEPLVKLRAKLYRFDTTNDDNPEWKERGTGELKILRHKLNNSVRIVMRRDKTLKVCANHFVTPWMELKPSLGSEKAFVYKVIADFADEEAKSECLAVKFGSVENANLFKDTFYNARKIVETQCCLYNNEGLVSDSDSEDDKENIENGSNDDKIENGTKGEDDTESVTDKLAELNVSNGKKEENETA